RLVPYDPAHPGGRRAGRSPARPDREPDVRRRGPDQYPREPRPVDLRPPRRRPEDRHAQPPRHRHRCPRHRELPYDPPMTVPIPHLALLALALAAPFGDTPARPRARAFLNMPP